PYATYVARITGNDPATVRVASEDIRTETEWVTHRVQRGETLSGIGGRYGVAVSRIQAENGIRGSRILVGQQLRIPVQRTVTVTVAADPGTDVETATIHTAVNLPVSPTVDETSVLDEKA